MQSKDIRSSFLKFFEEHDHTVLPSSSLVSKDPTVLLTTAGMQQFIPYFVGDEDAPKKRYTTAQKCFRTPDIDVVGDESHLTFFEMLGNFSIGDYFKDKAIPWAWEFVTEKIGLPKDKLWITYFAGDEKVPADTEARDIWLKIGVPADRVLPFGKESNFWGPPGESGPCGPCSEIHIDLGEGKSKRKDPHTCGPNCDCGRFLELWNLVFMQYYSAEDGVLTPLPAKNIDTGAGLERIAMVVQKKSNVFETDLFAPLLKKIADLTGKPYQGHERSFRIIADHVRGATFLIGDGVEPGKSGREYILRRIIRRAVLTALKMDLRRDFLAEIAAVVIENYSAYPELQKFEQRIKETLTKEEQKFRETINDGLKQFERVSSGGKLSGNEAFDIYQTYGFPIELIREEALERGIQFTETGYQEAFKKHQELSRIGAMDKFKRKGGGQGEEVKKAHTATHLLHQALRDVLGTHVKQAGSRLFDDELSFDFTHPAKMSDEERKKVEDIVNEKIKKSLPMKMEMVTLSEAKKMGAIGLFEKKYGDKVQICSILEGEKPYSREFCGGPHVDNTEAVQLFKITKEKSSSAGVRRIRAVVGRKAQQPGKPTA
jgi:alanyl-tRNA synthetase